MAKLQAVKRFAIEDYPEKELDKEKFFIQLNSFLEEIVNALQKNLNFADNFNAQIKELSITYSSTDTFPLDIAVTTKTKPIGVIILSIQQIASSVTTISSAQGLQYLIVDNKIRIQTITGLTNGNKYNLVLLVIGG